MTHTSIVWFSNGFLKNGKSNEIKKNDSNLEPTNIFISLSVINTMILDYQHHADLRLIKFP